MGKKDLFLEYYAKSFDESASLRESGGSHKELEVWKKDKKFKERMREIAIERRDAIIGEMIRNFEEKNVSEKKLALSILTKLAGEEKGGTKSRSSALSREAEIDELNPDKE